MDKEGFRMPDFSEELKGHLWERFISLPQQTTSSLTSNDTTFVNLSAYICSHSEDRAITDAWEIYLREAQSALPSPVLEQYAGCTRDCRGLVLHSQCPFKTTLCNDQRISRVGAVNLVETGHT